MSHLIWHTYTKLYWFIHHCPSFWLNRPVSPFNVWRKYFYRSEYQVFWDRKIRRLIFNIILLFHLYISTSYNWIWSFQQSRGALALQSSPELQVILGDTDILHIILLQNLSETRWRRWSMQHVWTVDLIRSKTFAIVTSLSFNPISIELVIVMISNMGNQFIQL